MAEASQTDDKPFDPTPRKLQKAREKGEIARSSDLNTAGNYIGIMLIAFLFGEASLTNLGAVLQGILARADALAQQQFAQHAKPMSMPMAQGILPTILPWFLGPFVCVCVVLLIQRAFLFTPSKLGPRVSRINPISNAKQKYGRTGMFEFAKSATKLAIYCGALILVVIGSLPIVFNLHKLPATQGIAQVLALTLNLFVVICLVALVIGLVDYLWQFFEHQRQQRMSHKELMDESKEAEGDPQFKQKRQQRAREIANNKMLADVPKADVIIVNPTHFAVALQWNREATEAPRCIAKGSDEIATRIRRRAQEHAIPIYSDPPTARALFADTKIGQEIDIRHYAAVAASIQFADSMRARRKGRL